MGSLKTYDKLLRFMYGQFDRGNNASGHGEHIQVLITRFEREAPGNRLGNAHRQQGAVRYLLTHDLIEAVDVAGRRIISPLAAYTHGRMQPTAKGRAYLRQQRLGIVTAAASVLGAFLGRFARSVLGR